MTYTISILRCARGTNTQYRQRFTYEAQTDNDTAATALAALNARAPLLDAAGETARPIEWECSCLQKKCGACAMLVDGRPRLACEAKLSEAKNGVIELAPLRKFPVVCDLIVDRSILFENLRTLRLWLRTDAALSDADRALAYAGSECIQCGCCLEICPNFYVGGSFFGMATVPITTRLLTETDPKDARELAKLYARHTFAGCGKSLSCRDVCPRGIDTEHLLVNANALAIWKRKRRSSL